MTDDQQARAAGYAGPVGFLGLGEMGARMAEALLEEGFALSVHDPRSAATERLGSRGAVTCASAAEVSDQCEVVLASLPTPDVVREAACGANGVVHGRRAQIFVDLSTTGPSVAADVAATLEGADIHYVDAPVSGGAAGAEARSLTVMTSGDPAAVARAKPLLSTFAQKVFLVGAEPGQAQLAKLLNNLLSATAMVITSEATTFAASRGLDPALLLEIFNASSGRNSATEEKFPKHVLTRQFAAGFRLSLMAKDVELCMQEARSRRFPMLLGGLVQQLWTLAASETEETDDHTEIVRLFEQWSGVTVTLRGDSALAGPSRVADEEED